tara:strand:- start:2195 stop:2413 length:219 start_codon:yes stop_codon:yes gene_type:complete
MSDKQPNPQKYKWTQKKRFNNYQEADAFRYSLSNEGYLVKVKRCGPGGTQFKVVVGTELKKNTKKEASNAAE